MKKTFSLMLIASFILISAFAPKTGASVSKSSKKIFWGSQSLISQNGSDVTVYYEWNTTAPIGSRVQNVSVTDNYGYSTFTVTYHDQYPYMNLVSGVIVTNGWRCNFNNQNGAADYVVLGGAAKP